MTALQTGEIHGDNGGTRKELIDDLFGDTNRVSCETVCVTWRRFLAICSDEDGAGTTSETRKDGAGALIRGGTAGESDVRGRFCDDEGGGITGTLTSRGGRLTIVL